MKPIFLRLSARAAVAASICLTMICLASAQSAAPHDHSQMQMDGQQDGHSAHSSPFQNPQKKKSSAKRKKPVAQDAASSHSTMEGMDHNGHDMPNMQGHDMGGHAMKGFLGPYGMNREGSGTSWQPDTSPHEGIHAQYGEWMTMYHAMFNGVYDRQGGPRGDSKAFVSGMVMAMAQREYEGGTFGLRAMLSPEPFMGPSGYPNLLASGETSDGRTHLIDRQHPHDLFMELAATYNYQLTKNSSVFVYGGLPGEPALGPTAFMHRTSGMDNPEAPITHHWLDSTHITFGVVTAGVVLDTVKLEASGFRGREPDQYRFDIEAPKLDSYSARATWNPTKELSMQVSWGHIESPESLVPTVNENRVTASLSYTKPFGDGDLWATTLAWGRKYNSPGNTLDGYLAESELIFKNGVTLFARAERVQNDELLERGEIVTGFSQHTPYTVSKVSAGGIYDFIRTKNTKFGLGALASRYDLPEKLQPIYGDPTSYMVFARLKIQ